MSLEAIEVLARFERNGKITPIRFTWRGTEYPVVSTGRRWPDSDGYHVLVMDPADQVFELLLAQGDFQWYLKLPYPGSKTV